MRYSIGILLTILACPGPAAAAESPAFTDITQASGLADIVRAHYDAHPAWWLSGLHLVDLDGDGDLDFFMSAHGRGPALATLNDGSGHFTVAPGSYPSTEIMLCYDRDEDGQVDLSMRHLDGGARWWRNLSRRGTLLFEPTDVTRGTNTARRQAIIDLNRDGTADWLRGLDTGIRFDFGDRRTFAQDSRRLTVTSGRAEVLCLPQDIDGDGHVDLLAEWGHYGAPEGNCRIFRNDGRMNFADVTAPAGLPDAGTAIKGVGDLDHDGDPDLICIERRKAFLVYLNDGDGKFSKHPGAISGIEKPASMASWGLAVTTDFDNDGTADVLLNGKHFLKLLRGTGGGKLAYMNSAWGVADTSAASIDDGLCFGDIDADGDLDLVGYTSTGGQRKFAVYRNDLPPRNWLRVRPVGLPGNRGAAGAKIRIYAPDTGELLWYEQVAIYNSQAAPSYYAHGVTERHFGLGDREQVDVTVEFYPSGRIVRRGGVEANTTVEVHEQAEGD